MRLRAAADAAWAASGTLHMAAAAFACLTTDPALTPLVLITGLAALAEAVAELRDAQQRATQAAAARAAERLYAAAGPAPAPEAAAAPRARTAAWLAEQSFPAPAASAPRQPAPGQHGPDQAASQRPARGPSPPRRR